ncbi:sensor histidine kinase [Nonomuraea mangrovi]|uniref:Sensor histidine kinase n=1 Tax=Nonomuraea mangrovi TaxID=2316207 RepID=A0ABW4SNG7_9ACTN
MVEGHQEAGEARGKVSGAAERELVRAASRYSVWLRSATVVPCGVFGVLAAPGGTRPQTAVLAVLAIGWSVLRLVWARNGTVSRAWTVVAVDVVVLAAMGVGQAVAGGQDSASWVYALISITAVTYPFEWCTRPLVGSGLAVLALGAYVAGSAVAHSGDWSPAVLPAVRVLMEVALARLSYVLIRSEVRAVDRLTERVAARRREAAVAAARRAVEREYLATLHDTASTTLLMVAMGTREAHDDVRERARQDLKMLTVSSGPDAGRVDLGALLATATLHPGVRVRQDIGGLPPVPAAPALAVFHGVREALTNVNRHAGVAEAALRAEVDEHGRIVVELRDRGRGFDPEQVAPHRRGISGSIVERMAAAGGRVLVASAPGEGTTLRWMWPRDQAA